MLSIPHVLIILLVALVVLGPDKLPQVARVMGKTMGELRRITGDFRSQVEGEMRELDRQAHLKQIQSDIYDFQPVIAPPPPGSPLAELMEPPVTPAAQPEAPPPAQEASAPEAHSAAASPDSGSPAPPEKPGDPHPA